ncbi:DUF5412 domain-containing protein [Filibacter tadaridae]|uniref:DUF5412 domain-containing protein n=2 Tax=Filibacter tadaridae TaxID=2483811 RepID=A0A3P5X1C2_9BACL|nr:hypothetical protein FILTAD_01718 [Filibacter tadaridae]
MRTKAEAERNKEKKKIYKNILIMFGAVGLLFVGLIGYGVYWAFFDMNRLPTGDYLAEETSPDGNYTLKAYVADGGATTSYTIRGELVFNQKRKKAKNVYWNSKEDNADIKWIDSDTVVISGHSLDVPNDKFDFRNQ